MTAIATPRLYLLPPTVTDIKKQVEWLNDPEVVKYSEQRHRKHDLRTQCEYIEQFHLPNQIWSITCDGTPIGTVSTKIDKHNSVADLGILIGDRTRWGQGFGSEAWQEVMRYMFFCGIRKIEAGCMSANQGMQGICRKVGMHCEGQRRLHFKLSEHDYSDMLLFARFNG